MSICTLHVGNFRGLSEQQEIEIRPITLFIGANSSGKSSCIHALACLAQTLKLPNNTRPISLDDEFAYVHLGRFIEVIHSKSYSDSISLGINLPEADYTVFSGDQMHAQIVKGEVSARYTFGCTKRTQDTFLRAATVDIGDQSYSAKKTLKGYEVTHQNSKISRIGALKSGFIFDDLTTFRPEDAENWKSIYNFFPLSQAQTAIQEHLRSTIYLGPFRQAPIRRYPTRGANPIEVGAQGEATITLLANEIVQSQSRPHLSQISTWLAQLGLATKISVSRVGGSDLFDVSLTLKDGKKFPIADLGYGLSQVLPVLTQCSFAAPGSTLLFEQPELHLHSLAARPLAKVFIETAKSKNIRIVAETHSSDLFGQFVREIREKTLPLEDFIAYRVARKNDRSVLTKIEIDPNDFDVFTRWENGLSIEDPDE